MQHSSHPVNWVSQGAHQRQQKRAPGPPALCQAAHSIDQVADCRLLNLSATFTQSQVQGIWDWA